MQLPFRQSEEITTLDRQNIDRSSPYKTKLHKMHGTLIYKTGFIQFSPVALRLVVHRGLLGSADEPAVASDGE